MKKLNNLWPLVLVSALLSLSACAKEQDLLSANATQVSVTEPVAVKEFDRKKSLDSQGAVDAVNSNTVETVLPATQIKPANVQVEEQVEEQKVAEVVSVATTAVTSEKAKSEWVKVEADPAVQSAKPSGTYAVPVAEELELGSAEEFLGLDQHKGKVIYLDFWASWCVPCRDSFPFMNAVQEKYKDDLVVVAVNLDEKKANAEKFLETYPANFRIVYDQLWQAGREYGIYGLPFSFVYNRKGELVGKHGGFKDGDEINLDAALKNLIASGE